MVSDSSPTLARGHKPLSLNGDLVTRLTDALPGLAKFGGIDEQGRSIVMTAIDLTEARKAKRRLVINMALIRFGEMSICCTVRNLSEEGAALDVGSPVGIPDQFTLIAVTQKKKVYSCKVVWRSKRRVGVAFY